MVPAKDDKYCFGELIDARAAPVTGTEYGWALVLVMTVKKFGRLQ